MLVNVIPGKTYAVTSQTDCTVTCEHQGRTYTLCSASSGAQAYFVSPVDAVTISDDTALVTETFKLAPQQKLALLGVLGGNADGLPAGYKRVEYLESSGTQYIDSGTLPSAISADDTITWKHDLVKRITSSDGVFSAFNFPYTYVRMVLNHGYSAINADWFAKANYISNLAFSGVYELSKLGLSIDGTLHPLSKTGNGEMTHFVLFAQIYYETFYRAAIKLYYWKVIGKYDFVPCLDETGAPCMYDKVSKQTFYNAGTGDFLYPTESTTYSLRRVLPDWGKLTERGLRRLYHAPANYTGELYDYALEHGYKPIIEPEMPEEGYWAPQWRETEDEIVLEWVETEAPEDEFLTIPTEQ